MPVLINLIGISTKRLDTKSSCVELLDYIHDATINFVYVKKGQQLSPKAGYLPVIGKFYLIKDEELLLYETQPEALSAAFEFKKACLLVAGIDTTEFKYLDHIEQELVNDYTD